MKLYFPLAMCLVFYVGTCSVNNQTNRPYGNFVRVQTDHKTYSGELFEEGDNTYQF